MTKRPAAIDGFLRRSGWSGATRSPLKADASFRSYNRLKLADKTSILMDAPPDHEDVRPFVAIAGFLRQQGLSAPEVTHHQMDQGLLLLEDLGDQSFAMAIDAALDSQAGLYQGAIDVLVHLLDKSPPPNLPVNGDKHYHLPRYDNDLFNKELMLFPDWYLPEIGARTDGAGDELKDIFEPLLARLDAPSVLVLRDYHADNLMVLPGRDGVAQIGLLDFQDGVLGHPAYDMVSLLDDVRCHVTPELKAAMIDRYLNGAAKAGFDFGMDAFMEAYNILGSQRNTKIIGIFTRLWRRDNKQKYLQLIPRVWQLLEGNLAHPSLEEAKLWFNERVPRHLRQNIIGQNIPGLGKGK